MELQDTKSGRRNRLLLAGLIVVIAAGIALFVYLNSRSIILDRHGGPPVGLQAAIGDSGAVVNMDSRTIDVYTTGSSSCPMVPKSVKLTDDAIVEVVLVPLRPTGGACTADLALTTSVVRLPEQFKGSSAPEVTLSRE